MRPARFGSRPTAHTVFDVLAPLTMLTCWLDCVPSRLKSCDSALKSGWPPVPPCASTLSVTVSPRCIVSRSSHARTDGASARDGQDRDQARAINANANPIQCFIRRRLRAAAGAGVRAGTCGATDRPDRPGTRCSRCSSAWRFSCVASSSSTAAAGLPSLSGFAPRGERLVDRFRQCLLLLAARLAGRSACAAVRMCRRRCRTRRVLPGLSRRPCSRTGLLGLLFLFALLAGLRGVAAVFAFCSCESPDSLLRPCLANPAARRRATASDPWNRRISISASASATCPAASACA